MSSHAYQAESELYTFSVRLNKMAPTTLSGSCACGSITYTSTQPPGHLDYCYCTVCQQMGGAPFIAWMGIPKSALQWQSKADPIVYRTTIGDTGICVSERTCCSVCASNLTIQYYLYPNKTHVAAGTIQRNDFDTPKVGCHIWCKSVPKWHSIPEDGIPRYDEFDDDFQALLNEYIRDRGC